MIFLIITLLIPLLVFCSFYFLGGIKYIDTNHEVINYFKFILPICIIINLICFLIGVSNIRYYEIINSKITSICHQEKWTTLESRTETYVSGHDSKGNPIYSTRTVKYTQSHGPYWTAIDEYGNTYNISSSIYRNWVKTWNNERRTGRNIGSAHWSDRAITGDIFHAYWTGDFEKIFPWSKTGTYTNKIRYSNTIFNPKDVSKELRKKYYRPADRSYCEPIITYDDIPINEQLNWRLKQLNALLGSKYQVHCMLILIPENLPRDESNVILNAWDGPNKNELCIFLGTDGTDIKWCQVWSWCDDTTIHSKIRSDIMKTKSLNQDLVFILDHNIQNHWTRKEFSDFDYIKTRVSPILIWSSAVLCLACSIAILFKTQISAYFNS